MEKFYVTKYALTSRGVFTFEGETHSTDDRTEYAKGRDGAYAHFYLIGKDAHRTWQDAVDRAEVMRQAKIKNLKKALEKLSKPIQIAKDK